MLTLFTIPKPFLGLAAAAQMNALRSWRELGEDVEILVLGDEEGAANAAARVGARHAPEIARNEWGTPLVSDAFAAAARLAASPHLCYANADIILLPDLPVAIKRLGQRPALLVGRRLDIAIDGELDFEEGWQDRLWQAASTEGRLGTEREIDYMAFPRTVKWEMPPLAVGRPGWDNWVLYRARRLGLAVVDATQVVSAVHQSHDYDHVPGRTGLRWQGPEADRNRALVAEMGTAYGILDATHVLTTRALVPARGLGHMKRRARRHGLLRSGVRMLDRVRGV